MYLLHLECAVSVPGGLWGARCVCVFDYACECVCICVFATLRMRCQCAGRLVGGAMSVRQCQCTHTCVCVNAHACL